MSVKKAKNFVQSYGRKQFIHLMNLFMQGENNQVIANHFGVSRERVRQWKLNFGMTSVTYVLKADIQQALADGDLKEEK